MSSTPTSPRALRVAPPAAVDSADVYLAPGARDAQQLRALNRSNRITSRIVRPIINAAAVCLPVTNLVLRTGRPLLESLDGLWSAAGGTVFGVKTTDARGARIRGEWVYGRDVPSPPQGVPPRDSTIMLYVHGSGYVVCTPGTHRHLVSSLSRRLGFAVFSAHYSLGPQGHFPDAGNDIVATYRWLLEQGYSAANIVVGGDSAGGHLLLDLIASNARDGVAQPQAAVLFSPLYDPTMNKAQAYKYADRDPHFTPHAARRLMRKLYFGLAATDADPRYFPRLVEGTELPAFMIHAGQHECLAGDAIALHEDLQAIGARSTLHIWPCQVHVFPAIDKIDGPVALDDSAEFLLQALSQQHQSKSG